MDEAAKAGLLTDLASGFRSGTRIEARAERVRLFSRDLREHELRVANVLQRGRFEGGAIAGTYEESVVSGQPCGVGEHSCLV